MRSLQSTFCFAVLLGSLAQAAVTRVEVADRQDLASFGYERLTGKAYFAVDPKLPANRIVADIDLAPRNPQGLVEFSSTFLVYRPKDSGRSNGTALVEISNRGGAGLIGTFGAGNDDGFLFEQGF